MKKTESITLQEIRRLVIVAIFSDDFLFQKLMLKGGSALELLYEIGARSSIDIDLSMEADFSDLNEVRDRIELSLRDRFDLRGLTVFDVRLVRLEHGQSTEIPLGYRVQFKVIDKASQQQIERRFPDPESRLEAMRRESEVLGPSQKRTFSIEISVGEFCRAGLEVELGDYAIRVYSPAMIAIEKLRAICQQMSEYGRRAHPTPRARDFYDIHSTISERRVDLFSKENIELLHNIFTAKEVPLGLLVKIKDYHDFHQPDWPSVQQSVGGRELKDFDFYFDYVVAIVERLESLGIMNTPS